MRFLCMYKPARNERTSAPPNPEHMAEMGKFTEEMTRAGVLLATAGLQPSSKGARIRLSNRKLTVIDGPFTESKELVAGYALVQARTKADAIELTKRFLNLAGDGECEIRQLFEASDFNTPVQ